MEKIDEALARMEGRLQHSSMPLAEEKRVLEDIKKLRASRVRSARSSSPMHACINLGGFLVTAKYPGKRFAI